MDPTSVTVTRPTETALALLRAEWANCTEDGRLQISPVERPIKMCNSDGTGEPLFSANGFGADVIRFAANMGVRNHTHEGDHILFVLHGTGIVEFDGVDYELFPGLAYYVPGMVNHAIRAHSDLVLIAVGNRHQPLGSESRMSPVCSEAKTLKG